MQVETSTSDGHATPEQYKDPDVLVDLLMITQSYGKHYKE